MSDRKAKKRWKNKKSTSPLHEHPASSVTNNVVLTGDSDIPVADDVVEVTVTNRNGPALEEDAKQQSHNGNAGSRLTSYNSPLRSKSSGTFSSFGGPQRSAMLQQQPQQQHKPPPLPLPSSPASLSKSVNNYTVRAQIESPPEPKIKSWPTSPEHKKVNAVDVSLAGVASMGGAVTSVNGTREEEGGINGQGEGEGEGLSSTDGNGRNVNGSKIPRRPSLNKSRSDEALASHRVKKSPPSRLPMDSGPKVNVNVSATKDNTNSGVHSNKGSSGVLKDNTNNVQGEQGGSSSPRYHLADNSITQLSPQGTPRDVRRKGSSGGGSGDHSPGCQSMASISSQATVMTTSAGGIIPLDNSGSNSNNNKVIGPQKHTLGEILKHIDITTQSLLEKDDFTHATTLPDLTFLAHQSRYSADPHIKRRLMTRLAECKVVEIFLNVFKSVQTVDYLATPEPFTFGNPAQRDGQPGQSSQGVKGRQGGSGAPGYSPRQGSDSLSDCYGSPRRPLDMMSEPGMDGRSLLSERLHNVPNSMKNLRAALTILVNASEKSAVVADCCLRLGVIQVLLGELGKDVFYGSEAMRDQNKMYLVKGYLGVLLNVIKHQQEARDTYRDAGAVKVLQQYLKSSLLTVKTRTLLLLSYVIGEAENDVINATERHLGLLVKMLQGALESDDHTSKKYAMHASELAAAVNRYATCESNKTKLVRRGVLPLFRQLMSSPQSSEEERMLGAKGMWLLAFAEENRAVIQQDQECLQALETLQKSSQREEIRKTASGALWVIQEHHIPVRPVNTAFSSGETQNDPDLSQHVLISYQWGAKHLVFKLKERLRAAGYKVCTDVERTDVPIMDGMASSVAQAAVVLLCLTHRFKESPSCRTEAEYAWHGACSLVPLKVQPHYNPDGWLVPIVDGRMTYDLSSDENLDSLLPNLIREIGNRGRTRVIEHFDALLAASSSSLPKPQDVATQTSECRDSLSHWSCEDVHRWLRSHDLTHAIDKLKHVNGELLIEIKKMRKDAPETFYSTVKSELKLNFVSVLRLTKALDDLDTL